jgi:hypothetical protein
MRANILVIVFKPDPVQGSGSGFWPGHRITRVNRYFKTKSKRRRFSKKKRNQRVATEFCRVAGSHRVMTFPIFSSTRPGSSPGSGGSWIDLPNRAGFQNYDCWNISIKVWPYYCFYYSLIKFIWLLRCFAYTCKKWMWQIFVL